MVYMRAISYSELIRQLSLFVYTYRSTLAAASLKTKATSAAQFTQVEQAAAGFIDEMYKKATNEMP